MKRAANREPRTERTFLVAAGLFWLAAASLQAQGMIPGQREPAAETSAVRGILIRSRRCRKASPSRSWGGAPRTLLSYKAPVEVLLVGFLHPGCPRNAVLWKELGRDYSFYKGWRVAFVFASEGNPAGAGELAGKAAENGSRGARRSRIRQALARLLLVEQTPTFLVIDENGLLRYRGPMEAPGPDGRPVPHLRRALDAVIGQHRSRRNPGTGSTHGGRGGVPGKMQNLMVRLIRFLPRRWWRLSAWKTWRQYVRWRMETYGVYYPSGNFNREAFRKMTKQLPSYLRWLCSMDRLHRRGG